MKFTRTREEKHTGMEFCCDTCNKKAEGHPRWIGNNWWYVRYNIFDEHPALWVCPECKEELE